MYVQFTSCVYGVITIVPAFFMLLVMILLKIYKRFGIIHLVRTQNVTKTLQKLTFLTLLVRTRTCAYQGVRNKSFWYVRKILRTY